MVRVHAGIVGISDTWRKIAQTKERAKEEKERAKEEREKREAAKAKEALKAECVGTAVALDTLPMNAHTRTKAKVREREEKVS